MLYPVCPFRALTGLLCPGCGTTHAVLALLHGHLTVALHENALFILMLPPAAVYALLPPVRKRLVNLSPRSPEVLLLTCAAAAFTVLRNL